DCVASFRGMAWWPVTIRRPEPPLHEFLPSVDDLLSELAELKMAVRGASTLANMDKLLDEIDEKRTLLRQLIRMREANPMLGFRGCRLGLLFPEVTRMQCRAIFEAACETQGEKKKVALEIMVPLVSFRAVPTTSRKQHFASAATTRADFCQLTSRTRSCPKILFRCWTATAWASWCASAPSAVAA